MSDAVISLTNRKKIPMGLPNGEGGQVNLEGGETKLVRGDYEHYRRMPAQGMNGLVVKLVEGKSRLLEAKSKIEDVRMVTVTNHRNIPMQLATGIGQKHVNLGPKATSEPFLGRMATLKQMSGITVRAVESETTKKPEVEASGNMKNSADAAALAAAVEADEKAKVEAELAAQQRKDAELNDPLAVKRRDLVLPATREEWGIHSQQMTWPDVRGLARELDIKTKSLTKEQLLEAITKELYPES